MNNSKSYLNNNLCISIITVVFNSVNTIEETILSVIRQSYKNVQYIIIDGSSTDGTVDVLKQYSAYFFYWNSSPDNGVYDAMNKAIKVATGDYVLFLGADDIIASSDMLQIVVSNISKHHQPNVFYGNAFFKVTKRVYDGKFNNLKFCLRNICHQAIFYPSCVFTDNEFDVSYKLMADYVFNLSILKKRTITFIYLPFIISVYNDSGLSANNIDIEFARNRLHLIRNTFPFHIYVYAYVRSMLKRFFYGQL